MPLDGDHVTFLKDVRDLRRRRNEKVWSPCPYYFINTINCHELFLSVTVCGEEKGQTNLISINTRETTRPSSVMKLCAFTREARGCLFVNKLILN